MKLRYMSEIDLSPGMNNQYRVGGTCHREDGPNTYQDYEMYDLGGETVFRHPLTK